MISAHVIIFGAGPRLRAICASLVRDCEVDVHILSVESRGAAAIRAALYRTQVVFLDARVAVEQAAFAELIGDARDVVVGAAIGWNGEASPLPAALKTRRPIDPTALDALFASTQPRNVVGSWLEPTVKPERRPAGVEPVRVHSYGWGFSGYAALSRNLMIGIDGLGVDVAWSADFEEDESLDVDEGDRARLHSMTTAHRPNETPIVFHPPTFADGRPALEPLCRIFNIESPIAITMFETDTIPARWREQLSRCAQVWVPASFNVESFVAGGVPRENLRLVPIGLDFEHTPLDGPVLPIPGRRDFVFLAVAEWTYRKGFDVLLTAYARAFKRDDDVTLVIRSHYAGLDVAAEIRNILKDIGLPPDQLPPILLLPRKLTPTDFSALYRAADAFVLPTRGEGFGIPCLESMGLGIPTISTAWGGSTDFLNAVTGFPIAATLEAVPRKDAIQFPIFTGQRWAEPSITSTAALMRKVFDHRDEARVIAARGAALARAKYNRETTASHALRALRAYHRKPVHNGYATGTVSFVGDVLSANGAGGAARSVMRALESSGFNVEASSPFPACATAAVKSDDAAFVKGRLRSGSLAHDITIVQARLGELGRFVIAGPTVIVTAADERVNDPSAILALNRARFVCVPSAACAAILERHGVDWRRLRVVPVCIDADSWVPESGGFQGTNSDKFRFMALIDWHLDDGWDTLVTAFAAAFNVRDNVILDLFVTKRDGSDQSLGERCVSEISSVLNARNRDKMLSNDIPPLNIRVGMLPEEDVAMCYGSADAFVLVPRTRCSSRVFLEAMACGLPTIAPRAGSHLAFMNDENSYLIDVDSAGSSNSIDLRWEVRVADLIATLRRVAHRPDERAEKARFARRTIVANHAFADAGIALRRIINREQFPSIQPRKGRQPMTRNLCIVVTASADSAQLDGCLAYLHRNTALRGHNIIVRGKKRRIVELAKRSVVEIGLSIGEMLSSLGKASHVAFIHDDVRVGMGWDRLLMDGLDSRVGAVMAIPQTNAALIPGQVQGRAELGYDPLTFADFDRFVIARALRFVGRGQYASMLFTFCTIVDANALKDVANSSGATCADVDDLLVCVLAANPQTWFANDVWVHNGGSAGERLGVVRVTPPAVSSRARF